MFWGQQVYLRRLTSDIWNQTSDNLHLIQTFKIWHLKLDVWHQTSKTRRLTTDTGHQTSDNRTWHQTSDIKHLKSDVWNKASDIRDLTSDVWQRTADIRLLKSDTWHQTSDIRHLRSDIWQTDNVSGFIAQLVEHRTDIARSQVQTPLKSFSGFFTQLHKLHSLRRSFLHFHFISAVHIWFILYIINTHFFHGKIWTQNWPAPFASGFIAQLVEHHTGIARSQVQTSLKSWIFFRLLYAFA